MTYNLLADLVVVIHFLFILFVLGGGLLVLCWRWMAWLHIPAVLWGALVELTGWVCPLTPLENTLRQRAGAAGYTESFVEQYILPVIYPAALTREVQLLLGIAVVLINLWIYSFVLRRSRHKKGPVQHHD